MSVMSFSGGTKTSSATGQIWDPRKKPHTAVYLGRRGAGSGDYENVIRANTEGLATDFNHQEIDNYIAGGGAAGLDTESYRTGGSPDYNWQPNGTYHESVNI